MKYQIKPYSLDQDMDWFISMQFESMRENNALDLKKPEGDRPAVFNYQLKRLDCDDDPAMLLSLWYQNFKTRLVVGFQIPEDQIRERFKEFSTPSRFDGSNTATFIATSNGGPPAGFVQIYQSKGDLGEQEYTWMWTPEISPGHPKNEVIESLIQQVESWTRERGLEAIRTGPYIGNDPRDWLVNRGYRATNLFMYYKI